MNAEEILLDVLSKEVRPSLGCTGPAVFSYVAAEAVDAIGGTPKRIFVLADKNKLSKDNDVGIPGSQYSGAKMATALGAFGGDPKLKLEALRTVTPETARLAREFALAGNIEIKPQFDIPTIGVYIDITVETENGTGRAIAIKSPTNLVYKSANGVASVDEPFDRIKSLYEAHAAIADFSIKDLYEFAKSVPVEKLAIVDQAVAMNTALAEKCLEDPAIGTGFARSFMRRNGADILQHAKALAAAGVECRMSGFKLPAMTCAESGNVGITSSMPLASIARDMGKSHEEMLRAVTFCYLVTILVKNYIGKQSALCACSIGSTLSNAAGYVMLMGGDCELAELAIQNTIVTVFGIVCDGARDACALKIASSVGTGIECARLALDGVHVDQDRGVCGATADESLAFLGKYAREALIESDKMVCQKLFANIDRGLYGE